MTYLQLDGALGEGGGSFTTTKPTLHTTTNIYVIKQFVDISVSAKQHNVMNHVGLLL